MSKIFNDAAIKILSKCLGTAKRKLSQKQAALDNKRVASLISIVYDMINISAVSIYLNTMP